VTKPKWFQSLTLKIIVSVGLTAIAVNASFGYAYLAVQERQMERMILRSAGRLSETIAKSIRFDMLENRKQHAYRVMETIGAQEGIEKVRIFGSEGTIIFSTDKRELGSTADKRAEACYACHAEDKPIHRLTTKERSRTFHVAAGHRVMGMINPINNEPGCAQSGCHSSPEAQKILGVIDVTMSLHDVDRDLARTRTQIVFFNVLSIIVLAVLMVLLIIRLVVRPVEQLVIGTNRVAEGDLRCAIPIASDDEMGHLARSFNRMTARLSTADEELREAQARLLRSEKLAAVGRMAATVAHEINNPLAGVFTYIRLIDRRISGGKTSEADIVKLKEHLATMAREVERATTIVLNLLDFTRPKKPAKFPAQVNDLLTESLGALEERLAQQHVQVTTALDDLPPISVDPLQMKQVFANILANACEAMEHGGELRVQSRRAGAGGVVVEFADTGAGIPPDVLSKIFDPFITTKDKATGLGLAVAYEIVARHDGKLEVQSTPGAGTCMTVALPAA
jgi:two-component system NtrC family sensor kinase